MLNSSGVDFLWRFDFFLLTFCVRFFKFSSPRLNHAMKLNTIHNEAEEDVKNLSVTGAAIKGQRVTSNKPADTKHTMYMDLEPRVIVTSHLPLSINFHLCRKKLDEFLEDEFLHQRVPYEDFLRNFENAENETLNGILV